MGEVVKVIVYVIIVFIACISAIEITMSISPRRNFRLYKLALPYTVTGLISLILPFARGPYGWPGNILLGIVTISYLSLAVIAWRGHSRHLSIIMDSSAV